LKPEIKHQLGCQSTRLETGGGEASQTGIFWCFPR